MMITGWHGRSGMSLRDWFAGMALMGMRSYNGVVGDAADIYARKAYQDADAMLNEREKP